MVRKKATRRKKATKKTLIKPNLVTNLSIREYIDVATKEELSYILNTLANRFQDLEYEAEEELEAYRNAVNSLRDVDSYIPVSEQ